MLIFIKNWNRVVLQFYASVFDKKRKKKSTVRVGCFAVRAICEDDRLRMKLPCLLLSIESPTDEFS
jgi:hypothetical protein